VALLAPPANHKDVADVLAAGGTVADLVAWSPDTPVAPDLFDELVEQIYAVRDKPLDDSKKLIRIRGVLDRLDPNVTQIGDPGRLVNWTEFIDEPVDESYNWVIPGVLERQDRVIVVAAEGVGKTMLSRQMAITTAYGVHPFTYERMAPVKTLTVDLENPERIIRRMSTKIIHNAARISNDVAGAHLLIRPAGMDLLNPADRIVLEEAIERTEPGLVCLGPLYKSFVDSGTRTSEALAVDVAKYLDYLRTTYNFALWLEHHAPLGGSGGRDLRPFGSAVWSRWPEFGWTLEPDLTAEQPHVYKWGRFRNDREPRHRPTKVRRGKMFPFEVIEFFKVD
jgi:replicative DNA helicase